MAPQEESIVSEPIKFKTNLILGEFYEQIGIVLTSTKGKYVEYEGGIQGQNRDNWMKVELESGKHTIFVSYTSLKFDFYFL